MKICLCLWVCRSCHTIIWKLWQLVDLCCFYITVLHFYVHIFHTCRNITSRSNGLLEEITSICRKMITDQNNLSFKCYSNFSWWLCYRAIYCMNKTLLLLIVCKLWDNKCLGRNHRGQVTLLRSCHVILNAALFNSRWIEYCEKHFPKTAGVSLSVVFIINFNNCLWLFSFNTKIGPVCVESVQSPIKQQITVKQWWVIYKSRHWMLILLVKIQHVNIGHKVCCGKLYSSVKTGYVRAMFMCKPSWNSGLKCLWTCCWLWTHSANRTWTNSFHYCFLSVLQGCTSDFKWTKKMRRLRC